MQAIGNSPYVTWSQDKILESDTCLQSMKFYLYSQRVVYTEPSPNANPFQLVPHFVDVEVLARVTSRAATIKGRRLALAPINVVHETIKCHGQTSPDQVSSKNKCVSIVSIRNIIQQNTLVDISPIPWYYHIQEKPYTPSCSSRTILSSLFAA